MVANPTFGSSGTGLHQCLPGLPGLKMLATDIQAHDPHSGVGHRVAGTAMRKQQCFSIRKEICRKLLTHNEPTVNNGIQVLVLYWPQSILFAHRFRKSFILACIRFNPFPGFEPG